MIAAAPVLRVVLLGLAAWIGSAQAQVGMNVSINASLSAPAAEEALSHGALAWDVRSAGQAGLPGAVRVDAAQLSAWLQQRDLPALEAALSAAGLDLSREVIIYGDAGDARAAALAGSLQRLSPGRVRWLVGGAQEWAMTGRALHAAAAGPLRHPVPQRLVDSSAAAARMAGAALRDARAAPLLAAL